MNEENQEEEELVGEDTSEDDDLQAYLKEMESLESDFSDLEDLDMDELKEMQDAITAVKEGEDFIEEGELTEEMIEKPESAEELMEQKEAMISDFSDMGEIDLDELREMKEAIEGVKQAEIEALPEGEDTPSVQERSTELEERLKEELAKRKEKEEEEEDVVTVEKFLDYIKEKRDKIWYHGLWYLTFEVDDHIASKFMLYDQLKEVTSKNAIDPIPEHQFYFGLGYILRLNINKKQVIRYMSGSKFKININIDNLKEMLEQTGEPISNRPILEESEKKQMYNDFLKDDFLDI